MSNDLREEKAKRLLNDPLLKEAFDTLEKSLYDTWCHSSVKEVDVREQTWLSMSLLERVRLHLSSIVETGEMAKKVKEYRI